MAERTGIEWTDATWNPIVGCSIVSPGCTNCYAMRDAARIEAANRAGRTLKPGMPKTHYAGTTTMSKAGSVWTGKIAMAPDHIFEAPLRWQRPRMVFVNSMGDPFHENVEDWQIAMAFGVMTCATQHIYQVLTKRADRMKALLSSPEFWGGVNAFSSDYAMVHSDALARRRDDYRARSDDHGPDSPPANIWLGVSAERQPEWDQRKEHLRATPAAIRFASFEPLLGSIVEPRPLSEFIDWAIVGGESGYAARPMHPDWPRSLRDQCAAAGVAYFFKQWGEWETALDRERDDPDWRCDYRRDYVDHPSPNGKSRWLNLAGGRGFHGERFHVMRRVGKKAAGRTLDGVEHNGMPGGIYRYADPQH